MDRLHSFFHGLKAVGKVGERVAVIAVEDGLPIAATFFPALEPAEVIATIVESSLKHRRKEDRMKGMGGWLIKLLSLIPYVVSGIEQIHGDEKSGAEKKQLAMEALGLAATTALTLDPGQSEAIQAAAALASGTIDGVKNVYNAVKKTAPVPAPAPRVPTVVSPASGFTVPS